MELTHYSVMLGECIDALDIKPDGIYVDATLGMGGHSYEIARRLKGGRLISIDRDVKAIERSLPRLEEFMDRITLVHGNFRDMNAILDELGIDKVDQLERVVKFVFDNVGKTFSATSWDISGEENTEDLLRAPTASTAARTRSKS